MKEIQKNSKGEDSSDEIRHTIALKSRILVLVNHGEFESTMEPKYCAYIFSTDTFLMIITVINKS